MLSSGRDTYSGNSTSRSEVLVQVSPGTDTNNLLITFQKSRNDEQLYPYRNATLTFVDPEGDLIAEYNVAERLPR